MASYFVVSWSGNEVVSWSGNEVVSWSGNEVPVQCPVCVPEEGKVLRLMTKPLFPMMFSSDCLVAMASVNPAQHKDGSEQANSQ